ncbi:MAG TPA: hypothetical protein VHQ00_12205 [Chloroflexota bacterium]|nr:hypothetical protein [Chloroflexota bacterium]
MAERDLIRGPGNEPGNEGPSGDDWDLAFSRLLEGVSLDEIAVPTSSGEPRGKLTYGGVRESVAEQLREKVRSERLRREMIERLQRQFEACSQAIDAGLAEFVRALLETFHGGGEARRLPDSKDGRSRSWQVLGYRSPGRADEQEPVLSVQLTMRGVDALDRGQPALECRVSTPRNPRLVDFTAGSEFRADLEDAVCRAYRDILGTLRFAPSADAGV